MRNSKKYWAVLLIACLSLLICSSGKFVGDVCASEDREKVTYATDDYSVTFTVVEAWDNKICATVDIDNIGNIEINNWSLAFTMNAEIEEIWCANVCANIENLYVIKNAEYNQEVAPGESVSFGFVAEVNDNFAIPDKYTIPMKKVETELSRYTAELAVDSEWQNGHVGELIITNTSDEAIVDWELQLELSIELEDVWDAVMLTEDDTYILKSTSYNRIILPGESVSVGYVCDSQYTQAKIINKCLTEITTAEIVDALIDEEMFVGIIPISDEYLICPFFTVDGQVSAYLIQYYSNTGDELSYIIVNNAVCSEDMYIIEFGFGRIPVVEAAEEYFAGENEYQIIYEGGYEYYIQDAENYYVLGGDRLSQLQEDGVAALSDKAGETIYYDDDLTYSEVLQLEVGYSSKEYNITYDSTASYVTTADTATAYFDIRREAIINHCAPTAAMNMLFNFRIRGYDLDIGGSAWEEVFCDLYDYMGTTEVGTYDTELAEAYVRILDDMGYNNITTRYYDDVSWSVAKSKIDNGAVHMTLRDSQIYGYHAVMAVGHIAFTHSSGWISKYFQIVDGNNVGYRYVNYSLGIDEIDMLTVTINPEAYPVPTPTP